MPGLTTRSRRPGATSYQSIPSVGSADPESQSSVYDPFYGSMPMPVTQYAEVKSNLRSLDVQPSVRTTAANASIVDRHDRRNGMISVGGRQSRKDPLPQQNRPVTSSMFQQWLIGPQVDYSMNDDWYIAYPAATISFGTMRNLALSERVPQLPTRTTGGPGPAAMLPSPRFKAVQQVPRYSTMPPTYPTASAEQPT